MCQYCASNPDSLSEHFLLMSSLSKYFCLQRPLWPLSKVRRVCKRLRRRSHLWTIQPRDPHSTHVNTELQCLVLADPSQKHIKWYLTYANIPLLNQKEILYFLISLQICFSTTPPQNKPQKTKKPTKPTKPNKPTNNLATINTQSLKPNAVANLYHFWQAIQGNIATIFSTLPLYFYLTLEKSSFLSHFVSLWAYSLFELTLFLQGSIVQAGLPRQRCSAWGRKLLWCCAGLIKQDFSQQLSSCCRPHLCQLAVKFYTLIYFECIHECIFYTFISHSGKLITLLICEIRTKELEKHEVS